MSTYDITLTDPLKNGFTIQPGAFDGPGGPQANTTLRLYGRGALEWGEAVDENLVRLAETFAGATPPLYPLPGQLYMRIRYYLHDTSAGDSSGWWTYDPDAHTWARLNGTGVVATSAPANPTIGSYYVNTGTGVLNRWDTAYKQAASAWMPRAYTAANLSGATPTSLPEHSLLVWDAFSSTWAAPLTVAVNTITPTNPQIGNLWYDQAAGKLKIWTGTAWSDILGPSPAGGTQNVTGNLNMNSYTITNLTGGTVAHGNTYAVNGGDVYDYVTAQINALAAAGQSTYLKLTGGTISGNLTVSGTTTVGSFGASSAAIGALTVTGNTSLAATALTADMNASSHKVTGLATPTVGTDATHKTYVDGAIASAVSSAVGGLGGITAANVSMVANGGAFKAGDVAVYGGKIYIAMSAGAGWPPQAAWKQVWPAVYS